MLVSEMAGVRPYFSTPEGLTGARGRLVGGSGCGTGVKTGCGAGIPDVGGAGAGIVDAGVGIGVDDLDEKIRAVIEAPAAADPAAISPKVVLDMLCVADNCSRDRSTAEALVSALYRSRYL